ncbi:MAG TPA: polysaccharide biosynthesis/export family protein [Pyrinomonadaceae bacterium]|jgi:polysaccharide export outer membrane protein
MKAMRLIVALAVCLSIVSAALAQQPSAPLTSGNAAPPIPKKITTDMKQALQPRDESSEPAAETPATTKALDLVGTQKYLLGPGDVLDLRVFNEPQFSDKLQVSDEGYVEVPFVGAIPARCRTDVEVRKDITTALTKFLRSPQVSLRITEAKSRPPAVVFGAVREAARVEMKRRVRLLDLLAFSGGVTEQAGGDIQIFHTEPVMCPEREPEAAAAAALEQQAKTAEAGAVEGSFTVYKLADLKLGKIEANPIIRPGDIIIVRDAPPVYVTGAVNSPTGLYLREKLPLSRAIAMVGGTRKGAKTSDVRIYRLKPGTQEQEIVRVNYDDIKKQKQPDMMLQAYDVIEVPEQGGFLHGVKEFILKQSLPMAGGTLTQVPLRILY